ncbi:uncharacterized protein PAC_02054 [Phialocephala subalpina]|uniref:Uncharacterized protein n=1 Tax=Phialocephala subalpina TaxID=576137 RepID=A0A1L7WHH0_9HELO|nr:uncharacterized protein PAC_02054 [Phialocephala subalpina]
MDTKSPSGLPGYDTNSDVDAPPAYNDTISSFPVTSSSSPSSYYSSQISSQLQSLTTQISSLETQKSLLAHAQDEKILGCLTTHIQVYLSDFASTGLKKGTLILVPVGGLKNQNAVPMDSDYDFGNHEEYDRLVRVRSKSDDGIDEGSWFWEDEAMTNRLVGILRPKPDLKNRELSPRKEALKKEESRGFWGRKKSASKPLLIEERRDGESAGDREKENGDRVVFDLKAEEVCFRSENEFGIYESESGWGIVLHLRVVLARR